MGRSKGGILEIKHLQFKLNQRNTCKLKLVGNLQKLVLHLYFVTQIELGYNDISKCRVIDERLSNVPKLRKPGIKRACNCI